MINIKFVAMLRLYVFLLFCIVSVAKIEGQSIFSKNIDLNGYADGGYSINKTSSGYLLTATSLCNNNLSECFSVVNTDAAGNLTNFVQYQNLPWWISTGGTGNSGVVISDSNEIYFSGSFQRGPDEYDVFLLKTNQYGDSIWMKTYNAGSRCIHVTMIQDTDTSMMLINEAKTSQTKILTWLVKVDLQGNVIWEKFFGENYKHSITQDIVQAGNGDILVSYLTSEYNVPSDPYSMTVTRLDPQGNEKWTHRFANFDGLLLANFSSLLALQDGNIVVSFRRVNPTGFFKRPPILIWLDSLGNIIQQYNFLDFTELQITDLIEAADGSIVGSGYADLLDFNRGIGGWVFAFSPDGEKLWDRFIVDLNFPDKFGWLGAVIQTDDKGLALVGKVETPASSDIWLVKLDSAGCFEPGCADGLQVLTAEKEVISSDSAPFKIYPNPVNQGMLNFDYDSNTIQTKRLSLEIADVSVYVVKGQPFSAQMDVSALSSGFYVLTIMDESGHRIFTEKVVVPGVLEYLTFPS
jgi:hypothetical protein